MQTVQSIKNDLVAISNYAKEISAEISNHEILDHTEMVREATTRVRDILARLSESLSFSEAA